jgi:hypothetical protein
MRNRHTLHLLLALAGLTLPATVAGAEWVFDHQVAYVGLDGPDDVACADLDGDGRMDLVVAADNGISWFHNLSGERPKWKRFNLAPPDGGKTGFMGMWTGDFDGDGDADVCASCKNDKQGYWFENQDGRGRKWKTWPLPYGGDIADHSRIHDFNGDGRDDIVMQRYHGAGVFYMPSPENPRSRWPINKIGEGRAGLSLHDVDGDGDVDVLVDNKWLENPGNPARENWPVHIVANSESHVKNAAGDLNGDGTLDFAHAEEEGNECYVILSPSWKRVTLKSDGRGLHTMVLADFDRDKDLDLVTGDIHGGRVYLMENADGKGTAWRTHPQPAWSKEGSHNLWVADFNADGRLDVVGKHYKPGSALEIWYNTLR